MINKKNVGLFLMLMVVNFVYAMDQYPLLERDISTLSDSEKKEYSKQREAYNQTILFKQALVNNITAKAQADPAEKVVIREELLKEYPGISSTGLNEIYLLEAAERQERQGERKIAWEGVVRRFISQ